MRGGGSIYSTFTIPDKQKLNELIESMAYGTEYHNKQGVFNFENAQEEFYSVLPLAMLRFTAIGDDRILGIIRLSSFFSNISHMLHRQPIIVVDNEGSIVGYNKPFIVCCNASEDGKASLLNKDIKDFLSPTPEEIQKKETAEFVMPDDSKWKIKTCLNNSNISLLSTFVQKGQIAKDKDSILWKSDSEHYSFIRFPETIDIDQVDIKIRVEISAPSLLPSIMLGESGVFRSEYTPDSNGFMIGPVKDYTALQLKKQGYTVMVGNREVVNDFVGICEYVKIGRTFVVSLNGKRAFVYHDFEGLYSKRLAIFVSIRNSSSVTIKNLELFVTKRDNPVQIINRFVALRNENNRQYLIEKIPTNVSASSAVRYSVFVLRDVSDIRKAMQDLEDNYKLALNRESKGLLFIAESKPMTNIRSMAQKAALTNATVLIQGETGTGKEVVARYIHSISSFNEGSFVSVDCSTIPQTLMESILFGHSKGAFTGATADTSGLFQQADNGTLFIDEIHNMSIDVQAKILRFLEDRSITPIGAKSSVRLNLRIIVATNADLMQMVNDGKFRRDLYYRIAVIVLQLPPLRERLEDLPSLIDNMIHEFNHKYSRCIRGLTSGAYKKLFAYGWPGNVRELRNVLERAVIFCRSEEIEEYDINIEVSRAAGIRQSNEGMSKLRKSARKIKLKADEIVSLMQKHQGYIIKVANELQVTRQTLYQYLRKNGISPDSFR